MDNNIEKHKNNSSFDTPDKNHDPFVPDNKDESSTSESEPDEFEECECDIDSGIERLDRIPYMAAYDTKEAVQEHGYFIPAFPVDATIVKVEKDQQRRVHLISPYKYTIELKHGPYEWTIIRRYIDFQRLHTHLSRFRRTARLTAPFKRMLSPETLVLEHKGGGDLMEPTTNGLVDNTVGKDDKNVVSGEPLAYYNKAMQNDNGDTMDDGKATVHTVQHRSSKIATSSNLKTKRKHEARHAKLPHFPILPDSVIPDDGLEERKSQLQNYLSLVLHKRVYRDHASTANFLEVSRLSFIHNLGGKFREGMIKRRPGGSYTTGGCRNFCVTHCLMWRHCWLVLKDSYITYVNPREELFGEVLLFDHTFKVLVHADQSEETEGVHKGLHVSNLQRELLLKCKSGEEAKQWKNEIEKQLNSPMGHIWVQEHQNKSTFPLRTGSYGHWLVDGRSFMEHAANMMEIAKEEIFITDWWLNPQIYLKRPDPDNRWRLDQILKRRTEEGVRVYVLVYREVTQVLALGSQLMEEYLMSLHPNIKVLRHPDHFDSGVYSYAHHEKLIVVDQSIAFVGGIDLCYGRWDDHEHRLTDLGGLESHPLADEQEIRNLDDLKKEYQEESSPPPSPLPGQKIPDVSPGASVNAAFSAKPEIVPAAPTEHVETLDLFEILKMKRERMEQFAQLPTWKTKIKSLRDELAGEYKELWMGKDYGNALFKDLPEPEKAFDDFVDRSIVPRMPWHDISSVVYGSAARDIARHFIQRWNDAKIDLVKSRPDYPFLLPKSYVNMGVPKVFIRMAIPCNIQVLRSCSTWSAGLNDTECSIQNAYVKLITEAKHYVFIENQFFISHISGTDVHNKIAQALLDRITRAFRERETFRVYVLMPLLPAFLKNSGSMQMVLHWTCTSISKGQKSLLWNLQQTVGDYSEYITFCGLRNYSQLLGKLVTELIYIHSKLMIVDDRYCIIGSANINDRSQLGNRDSEVCVLFEDSHFTPSTMNGQPYQSGSFAGSLRRRLFQEHLGLLCKQPDDQNQKEIIDVTDPISSEFFSLWNNIAKQNTEIYDQVFKCAPSNEMKTLQEWAKREAATDSMATKDKSKALKMLENIRGHLVSFPLEFLSEGDLLRDRFTPEALMPNYIFT